MKHGKKIKSTDNQIISRIYGHSKGCVFTPDHFNDLGNRDAIASVLKRHKHAGLIRRLIRGLCDQFLMKSLMWSVGFKIPSIRTGMIDLSHPAYGD